METIITYKCDNILETLKEMYPTGMLLGDAYAIVGDLGLTISWFDKKFQRHNEKIKADERIPITEIKGESFVLGGLVPVPTIHYSHFKGFFKIQSIKHYGTNNNAGRCKRRH